MYTADGIRNTGFQKSGLSGYKAADVDEFCERVADDYEKLEQTNIELVEKIKILATHIRELQEKEESVKTCIINAQISADKVMRQADEKSKEIISASEEQAENIINDAQSKADYLFYETKKKSEEFITAAKQKADSIIANAEQESIALRNETDKKIDTQKRVYERLKNEIVSFREKAVATYMQQLDLLNELSDSEIILDKVANTDTTDEMFSEKFANNEVLPDKDDKKEELSNEPELAEIDEIVSDTDDTDNDENQGSIFEYRQ